jgi:hypothetical protein
MDPRFQSGRASRGRWRWGIATAVALILLPVDASAADPPRLAVDWSKLALLFEPPPPLLLQNVLSQGSQGSKGELQDRSYGTGPRLALVARDWEGSRQIVGGMGLLDEMRLGHSSRMVVSRLLFVPVGSAPLVPFAQVGAGEWRVDATLFPGLPRERVLAAQAGVGFELALGHHTSLAIEGDSTFLQARDPSDVLAQMHPLLWDAYAAMRTRF